MSNINITTRPITGRINYFTDGLIDDTTIRNDIFPSEYEDLATSLDPIGNPIIFELASDTIGSAQKSEIYINFTGATSITSITFFDIVFTESVDANLTATQFYNSTFSIQERIDSLVNAINQNINLNWRYTAFNDNNIFCHIVANQPGSIYSITAPYFSMIPNLTTGYVAGADSNRGMLLQNYNYRCFVELFEYDYVEWNRNGFVNDPLIASYKKSKLVTLSQPRNTENKFNFDLSKFFDIIKPAINYTSSGTYSNFTYIPDQIKSYYIRFGESFIGGYDPTTDLPIDTPWNVTNTNETKRYLGLSEIRWCSNGTFKLGILNSIFPNYRISSQSSISDGGVNDYQTIKALSDFEGYKLKRRIDEPEYISILVYNDQQDRNLFNLRLCTNYTFVDGTVSLNNYTHETINLSINGMYKIDAGFTNINFNSIESTAGKRVLHYECIVQISYDTINYVNLTEEIKYKIDLNSENASKYKKLWWYNNLGALDSFEFEGLRIETINYNQLEYSKSYKNNFYERNRHINQPITKLQKKVFTLNSGWLTIDEMAGLKSLLASNLCYSLEKDSTSFYIGQVGVFENTEYVAVNIVDSTWSTNNIDKVFNLEIKIEIAIPENSIV